MPRVLADLLFMTGSRGGMESYVRSLYGALGDVAPELELIGVASSELASAGAPWFPGELIDSGVDASSRVSWARAELETVGRIARRVEADLVHAPANVGPVTGRTPTVVTVHDLLPFRHPEYVPGPYSPVLRAMVRGAARHARRVLTVSEASAGDIERVLKLPRSRIDVVPLAGLSTPSAPGDAAVTDRGDFLLTVGNAMPHKNQLGLLRALARIPARERPPLVIVGAGTDSTLRRDADALGLGAAIDIRGWVDDAELERLYATAAALVLPSRFEGFGLPVLEGMSRGCPVLCSDIPAHREVGGDAVRYFRDGDAVDLAAAVRSVIVDGAPGSSRAGLARSREFSWTRTAELTRQSFARALGSSR